MPLTAPDELILRKWGIYWRVDAPFPQVNWQRWAPGPRERSFPQCASLIDGELWVPWHHFLAVDPVSVIGMSGEIDDLWAAVSGPS
jgi:hypothetical protein